MKRGRIMVNLWCLSKRDKKIVLYILVHCSIAHNLWCVMLDFFLVVWATKEVFQSWLCGVHGRNRSMGSLTGAELTESKLKELPLWRLFSCTVDFAVKSRISFLDFTNIMEGPMRHRSVSSLSFSFQSHLAVLCIHPVY